MSKPLRMHAPGCIIHITARTHGHKPWFTDALRSHLAAEILAAGQASGHTVLAFVIMPNHFHIVVRQGVQPLSAIMHRVMHRSAARLRASHRLQGHVFERRYWSGICADAVHVRATIAYVHLNPCRAELCSEPGAYAWSSHNYYLERLEHPSEEGGLDATMGLRFFQSDETPASALRNYLAHVNYQMNVGRFLAGELDASRLVAPVACTAGDAHWQAEYAAAAPPLPEARRPLYDVARVLLAQLDPHCPLDLIRSGTHARPIVTIRRNLIAALLSRGYRGVALARFFGVSATLVSRIRVS